MTKNQVDSTEVPVICIQCDWDEVILSLKEEIWISCKQRGQPTVHSKLGTTGKSLRGCVAGDFSVLSCTRNSIEVRFNPTGHVCIFLAATKTLSKIHDSRVVSTDVTNGGLGVSVCDQGRLTVWNASSGETVTELRGHKGGVYRCRFFPSGLVVLSGGADRTLKIWSAETGDCPVTLVGHLGAVNDFCIVDRGRNVMSVSKDGTAKLWDCGNSACLATVLETSYALNCCSLGELPEGSNLTRDDEVSDREIGTLNKLLVVGSEEGFLYGVGVYARKTLFSIDVGSAVNVVLVLSNIVIVGCQNGSIKLYETGGGEEPIRTFNDSTSPVLSGCTYKDKGFFAGRRDGTVTYYDCVKFSHKRISLTGPDIDPVTDISLNSLGKLHTSCRDGKIREYFIGEIMSTYYNNIQSS